MLVHSCPHLPARTILAGSYFAAPGKRRRRECCRQRRLDGATLGCQSGFAQGNSPKPTEKPAVFVRIAVVFCADVLHRREDTLPVILGAFWPVAHLSASLRTLTPTHLLLRLSRCCSKQERTLTSGTLAAAQRCTGAQPQPAQKAYRRSARPLPRASRCT